MVTSVAERSWVVVVPHHPRGAGQARARMAAEIGGAVRPELLADAVSIMAELVGNAIRHADALPGDVIRVAWRLTYRGGAEIIELRVTDGGSVTVPQVRHVDADSTDGRGLAIIEALANVWGYDRDGLGQTVWAELSLPSRPSARDMHRAA